jgi:hypothetical protein
MRKFARALAFACGAVAFVQLGAAEIAGRYATQTAADASGGTGAGAAGATEAGAQIVEITAHRNAYAVTYQSGASRHKRRGWGLLDAEELVVAPSTGGSAYGVAIYHHDAAEHAWSGPWISSLDGGATPGQIRFAEGAGLEGRHALFCTRPGAGGVSGTVEIKPAANGYQLTFNLGRAVYYRGVGLSLPGDRLAVGWSFGSAPELATYQPGPDGALLEHHISWTPRPGHPVEEALTPLSDDQYFAAMNQATPGQGRGSSTMPLFASPPEAGEPSAGAEAAAQLLGPAAPQVKAWSYPALLRQYGADGWAERWLERQLTAEEYRLFNAALRRHGVQGDAAQELEHRSIGTLIEDQRAREAGR